MPLFLTGPQLVTPLTPSQFNLYALIPPDRAYEAVIGVMFHNDTPWEILVNGYNQSVLRIRPDAEVYVPNTLQMELPKVINLTPKNSAVYAVGGYKLSSASLNFTLYFEGEEEPPSNYTTNFQANLAAIAGPAPLIECTFLANNNFGNQGSANTVVMQASFPDLTSPLSALFLSHVSFFFGVPSAAASGVMTITDNGGNTWFQFHLNMGIAPMPGVQAVIPLPNPPKTFPNLGTGIASWTWTQPIVTNGPGYSINMAGYSR